MRLKLSVFFNQRYSVYKYRLMPWLRPSLYSTYERSLSQFSKKSQFQRQIRQLQRISEKLENLSSQWIFAVIAKIAAGPFQPLLLLLFSDSKNFPIFAMFQIFAVFAKIAVLIGPSESPILLLFIDSTHRSFRSWVRTWTSWNHSLHLATVLEQSRKFEPWLWWLWLWLRGMP